MTNSKYELIWKILDIYCFEFDNEICKDLMCVICNKILRNSTQSSCGCRYCYLCISNYLNGEDKCCPKYSDDCKEHIVNFKNDLQIDHAANKMISNLVVVCPESHCDVRAELKNMVEHIKSHEYQCPFNGIGCHTDFKDNQEMKRHLDEQSHDTIIADSIQNFKLEIGKLKAIISSEKEIIKQLKISNIELRSQVDQLISGQTEMCNRINILEEECQYKQNSINEMMEEIVKMGSQIKKLNQKLQYENPQENTNTIRKQNSTLSKSPQYAPFSWNIENFLMKWDKARNGVDKYVHSDLFLSHEKGYTLRLSIYFNGYGAAENKYISVMFGLMNGEFDEHLPWPMKREITIGLMDQVSGSIHLSEKYKYDSVEKCSKYVFHRPSRRNINENYYYGASKFIKVDSLIGNNRLFKKGSILLKCFVH